MQSSRFIKRSSKPVSIHRKLKQSRSPQKPHKQHSTKRHICFYCDETVWIIRLFWLTLSTITDSTTLQRMIAQYTDFDAIRIHQGNYTNFVIYFDN